ncbi:MAG: hypothetical protein J5943_04560 [Oribacterium sp.]|nr:hypothetical protein [Oribacterium sp.]
MEKEKKIAYQNKDIASKILSEQFRGKSFSVYGIDLPEIEDIRPTNLPAVEADELRLDNLFLLADGSYVFVDYESEYREKNKCDYLKYFARITERLYNEFGRFVPLKLVIIYTADVKRGTTDPVLDTGGVRMEIEEAFLTELDAGDIWKGLKRKIESGESLSDEDMMRMIIYPLTFRGRRAKQEAVARAIGLAKKIENENRMYFVLKMMLVFSDKFITNEDTEKIKEVLTMTKLDRLYAEEKRQAVDTAVSKAVADTTESITTRIAKNFLKSGDSVEKVSANTGLPISQVLQLSQSL